VAGFPSQRLNLGRRHDDGALTIGYSCDSYTHVAASRAERQSGENLVMSEHRIALEWSRNGGSFERGNYSQEHLIRYSGGQTLRGAPSSDFGGNDVYSDPEQLLLSALSACHMLTFLAVAANRGYVVDNYSDQAVATLDKNADGKIAVIKAVLTPKVAFSGDKQPSTEEYAKLHERAHAACFIANSVKTVVEITL
jgi:organic hydroperoxide reductase OsmC/OhrA